MRGEGLGGMAIVVLDPGKAVKTFRDSRAVIRVAGVQPEQRFEQRPGLLVRSHRPGEIAGCLLHITDGDQAGARVADCLPSRRRLRCKGQAKLQPTFGAASASAWEPILAVSSPTS